MSSPGWILWGLMVVVLVALLVFLALLTEWGQGFIDRLFPSPVADNEEHKT